MGPAGVPRARAALCPRRVLGWKLSEQRGKLSLEPCVEIPVSAGCSRRDPKGLKDTHHIANYILSLSLSRRSSRLNKPLGTETIISLYLMLTVSKRWITK